MHVLTSFQGANEIHLTKDASYLLENKSTWTLFEQFGLYIIAKKSTILNNRDLRTRNVDHTIFQRFISLIKLKCEFLCCFADVYYT